MVSALSTGHQIGLAGTGAAFIVFSLVSSFGLPRMNPNFPGRWRLPYIALCVAFFLAMMSAVVVFGREQGELHKTETEAHAATPAPVGDAAAGKVQFTKSGCVACHTFAPAGSTGTVGPNLNDLTAEAAAAKQPLDKFIQTSIVDPNAYIAPGYQPNVMPQLPLTKAQVADLVAFLTSGS